MPGIVNPILPTTALLRPTMPGVYGREMIYDPTFASNAYTNYTGQKIVPAVNSLVHDINGTPLWVVAVDPVTYIPTYEAVSINNQNDNVTSLLNYGNSLLRLYVDNRALPYPATVDSKCIFLGKSPRFYNLIRYPGTPQQTIISQYFDSTGTLLSSSVPLVALDSSNSSWYLPRCNISVLLEDNEEIGVQIYDESGAVVQSALLFSKQSAVINEDVMYSPQIVGMTVAGTQRLSNGTFFVYEKQNFESLGLSVTLVYSDGTTTIVPIDNVKCFMYGQNDFISSFAGLTQNITIKYFRSSTENISPSLADPTGSMITRVVPVTVIANGLNTTAKISVLPYYNASLSQYAVKYWMYFANGNAHIDVTPYVTIVSGQCIKNSSYYGTPQLFTISVDMSQVDPVTYPGSTIYTQVVYLTFFPPTQLVQYSIADGQDTLFIYGLDNANTKRPVMHYDSTINQYYIPAPIFINQAAFLESFYYNANPPHDPAISAGPQVPTSFCVRDLLSGIILTSGTIPVGSYPLAFNFQELTAGTHNNGPVVVEFLNRPNISTNQTLYGVVVSVSPGTYI